MSRWIIHSLSDIGYVRKKNEDYVYSGYNGLLDVLLVVCDGIGSYLGSEFASAIVTKTFQQSFLTCEYLLLPKKTWFNQVIQKAKYYMQEHISHFPIHKQMCTTLVLVLIQKNQGHLFWIGDSRAYLLSAHKVIQMTQDHNLLNYFLKHKYSKAQIQRYKKNWLAITNSIRSDCNHKQAYDYVRFKMKKNRFVFLASDGFYNFYQMNSLYQLLCHQNQTKMAQQLAQQAVINESNDNITFAYFGLIK